MMGDKRALKSRFASHWMEKVRPAPAASGEHNSVTQSECSGEKDMAALSMSDVLESKVFTVVVGANRRRLAVHESALSKSPVLRRFCSGPFLEATTGRIELLDDDPEIFNKVLSYLYREDYEPFVPHPSLHSVQDSLDVDIAAPPKTTSLDDKHAMDSAMVYIMADKYQLDDLKKLAIWKLKLLQSVSHDAFFSISSWVYARVPESDMIFRDFFVEYAPQQLSATPHTELAPYVREGGALAEDVVYALRSHIAATEHYVKISSNFWRLFESKSPVAKLVYAELQQQGAVARRTSCYRGTRAAFVASAIKRSLQDVLAAGKELKSMGFIIGLGAWDGSH